MFSPQLLASAEAHLSGSYTPGSIKGLPAVLWRTVQGCLKGHAVSDTGATSEMAPLGSIVALHLSLVANGIVGFEFLACDAQNRRSFKVANGTVVESSWLATLHIPIGGTPYGYRLRVYVVDTGAEPDAQVPLLLSNPTLGEWDALMDSRTGVYQLHSVNRYGVRCARSRAGHHLFPIVASGQPG